MRKKALSILVGLSLAAAQTYGQGFIYDQQSSTNESPPFGGGSSIQSSIPPYGQSFTPSLSAVGFIQVRISDHNPGNSLGATVFVNLRSDSIDGTIIGVSTAVVMPDGFGGVPDFLFTTPVTVTPGTTYFFQPVVQSGDSWDIFGTGYGYPGGSYFFNGAAQTASDLWFREGILAPEPSTVWLGLVALGVIFYARRRRITKSRV